MDERYIRVERWPELEKPVMVVAFEGWNDAGEAASVALNRVEEAWEAERFAGFDSGEFYDFQVSRPQIHFSDGLSRSVEWPENTFKHAHTGSSGAYGSAVLLSGPEPNYRWQVFTETIVEVAKKLDVGLVVTMGALLADVPHTRPVPVSALSQDTSLIEGIDVSVSRYEGPTGITGVVHSYCEAAGLPSVSLWASVPHYLPSVPSAPAALALLERVQGLLGVEIDTSNLDQTAGEYREQIAGAVSQDEDLASYVQMLEERYDSSEEWEPGEIPSGDDLASELEGFLKERRDDEEQQ